MLETLEVSSLEQRRSFKRLVFQYKVVEGLVPALSPDVFLKPEKPKRQIKARQYTNYISKNIVDGHRVTNDRSFVIKNCRTEQLKQSFFIKTVVEWNHLDQDQDQDSLLVKRRNDNHSPGPVIRALAPSSHQRSELSNTTLCIFSR